MIIPDLTRKSIETALKRYFDQVEKKRNKERNDLIRYYEHNSTDKFIKAYFSGTSLKQLPAFTQAYLKRAVNRRSLVYKKPAEVVAPPKYIEMIPTLGNTRRQLEKLTFLLGTMAVRSRLHKDWDKGKKELDWDIIPFFKPLFIRGEKEPSGIIYPLYNYEDARINEQISVVWTEARDGMPGLHFRYEGVKSVPIPERRNLQGEAKWANPHPTIPITFVHRAPQISGEWWVEGATDLMRANFHLDVALTEMALAYRFDAVGIKWIEGAEDTEEEELPSGVDKFMMLPQDAKIGRLEGGDLEKLIGATKFFAEVALQNNHLMIKWADTGGQAKSAEALKMENIENVEEREANVEDIWRGWEHRRYEKDKMILEYGGVKIPETPGYQVNFTEPTSPMTQEEERKQWEWEFKNKISTIEDYIRAKNPDITEEDLAKKLGKIEEVKKKEKEEEIEVEKKRLPQLPSLELR